MKRKKNRVKDSAQKKAPAKRERDERHFQVTQLDMVSDHCSMGTNKTKQCGICRWNSVQVTEY
jgi:hypothetical protein